MVGDGPGCLRSFGASDVSVCMRMRNLQKRQGQAAAEFGIKYDTLYRRLNSYGYSVEEAVALPAHESKRITVKRKTP